MKIIALSAGIAAGKNYIADIFVEFGAEVFDADKVAHELMAKQDVIALVAKAFPEAIVDEVIDRGILAKIVFADEDALHELEEIIHPLVRKKYQDFLIEARGKGLDFVVLNIPLILEKLGYEYDYLLAIITDFEVRKRRFVARELQKKPENVLDLEEKFAKIVACQLDDEKRLELADFVLDGGAERSVLRRGVEEILGRI